MNPAYRLGVDASWSEPEELEVGSSGAGNLRTVPRFLGFLWEPCKRKRERKHDFGCDGSAALSTYRGRTDKMNMPELKTSVDPCLKQSQPRSDESLYDEVNEK